MPTPERTPSRIPSWLPRLGFYAAAFAVFACGWLGMRTADWRFTVLYAVLALGAALLAASFSRMR